MEENILTSKLHLAAGLLFISSLNLLHGLTRLNLVILDVHFTNFKCKALIYL